MFLANQRFILCNFLLCCPSQRSAQSQVPSQLATHQEIGNQLWTGEKPDLNPGLQDNSLACYHWVTMPPYTWLDATDGDYHIWSFRNDSCLHGAPGDAYDHCHTETVLHDSIKIIPAQEMYRSESPTQEVVRCHEVCWKEHTWMY
jgi:hypothetical protein